jgi:predicted TIM-barrel fold metal-dependent hydrolase
MNTISAVDCHAHVMLRDAPMLTLRHSRPARDVPAEEFLSVLDAHHIARGVLTAPSFYGFDNTVLRAATRAHPDRLRGTVILDPDVEPELSDMAADGIVGIRLNWTYRDRLPDITSPGYTRLLHAVRERDWHVELFVEGAHMPALLPVIQRSGAKLVLDHFGCPDPVAQVASPGFAQVLHAVRDGNCWVKLSAPYRLGGADPQPYVDALLQAGGPQRLVWASDWPWLNHEGKFTYQDCLDWLTTWVPDDATRSIILADTPAALFGF